MLLIWVLSSMSFGIDLVSPFPMRDKGVHFIEYAVLAFLLVHASIHTWPRAGVARILALAIGATIAWGALDEIHQALVPERSADIFDLVADSIGAIAGSVIRMVIARVLGRGRAEETHP